MAIKKENQYKESQIFTEDQLKALEREVKRKKSLMVKSKQPIQDICLGEIQTI
jgi:hypothetical protein